MAEFRLQSGCVLATARLRRGYGVDTVQMLRGCCAAAVLAGLGLLAFAFAFAFASRWAVRAVTRVHFVMLAASRVLPIPWPIP